MNAVTSLGLRGANKILNVVGLQVRPINPPPPPWDLSLYPEKGRTDPPRYLNIGAGYWYHPCWHNLNYTETTDSKLNAPTAVDINHDLMSQKPFPIPDGVLRAAFTSHCIEHIRDEDVAVVFREIYRCLEPGALFRVTCPDMVLAFQAFQRGDLLFWYWPSRYGATTIEQRFLEYFATPIALNSPTELCSHYTDEQVRGAFAEMAQEEAFDYFSKQIPVGAMYDVVGHMNWFDVDKVIRMLREAGFEDIWESRHHQSLSPIMRERRSFDLTRPEYSLYVECRK